MKKAMSLLTALLISASAVFAQELGIFNHLSIGVGLLGTDGEGIQVAAPLGNHFQVRGGFTTHALFPVIGTAVLGIPAVKNATNGKVESVNPFRYKLTGLGMEQGNIKIDNLDVEGKFISNNPELLFDFFPFRNAAFHITAGAYFNLNPKGLIQVKGVPTDANGNASFPESMRANARIYGITSDPDGNILLDAQWKNKVVRPYLGIGFGRPVSLKRRVGVNFDLGVAYTGGLRLVSYDYFDDVNKPNTVVLDGNWVDNTLLKNADPDNDKELIDYGNKIKDYTGQVDKYSKFWPVMKLTLFIRLF